MRKFHLEIVTPDGPEFEGYAESLLVKTKDGDVEILAGHADYIAAVDTGRVRIISEGSSRFASANGGFLSVSANEAKLVCITFEFKEDIDLKRAEAAKLKAEESLSNAKDERAIELATAKLKRAISRINVASLR